MTPARRTRPRAPAAGRGRRWLVFVHQLPAHPSNGRVKTWRRLQQIGAVRMKNAVHVLPNTPQAREDFEWLRSEVMALGGRASIFETSSLSKGDERHIFRQLRDSPPAPRPPATPQQADLQPHDFQQRQWVTRPRPGVDRFASAWLIRRFVDASAIFIFAAAPEKYPDAVPFDMYQATGFRHEGEMCTFEVLAARFGIRDEAVRTIAGIVHDIDLKDDRFKSVHTSTMGMLVEGLRAACADDGKLLERGMAMFEALYQSLQPVKRTRGGKPKIC